jgi:hypothetical protein
VLAFQKFNFTEDFSVTSTFAWNASLALGVWLFQDIGSHVALILIFQRNGSSLKKAFQNMDSAVPELYTKCRWAVLVCLVYIIVKVSLTVKLNELNYFKFEISRKLCISCFKWGGP